MMNVTSHTGLFMVYVVLGTIFIAVSVLIIGLLKQFLCIKKFLSRESWISSYEINTNEHCSGNNFTQMLTALSYKLKVWAYLQFLL